MTTLCYNDFKLKLRSDFRDWYDHQFDLEGMPFQRPSVKESRDEGLTLLKKKGTTNISTYKVKILHNNEVILETIQEIHRGSIYSIMVFGVNPPPRTTVYKEEYKDQLHEYIDALRAAINERAAARERIELEAQELRKFEEMVF